MPHNPIHNDYRPFCWKWWEHWLDPRTYYYAAKVFYQRGTRGWSYVDTWGLDSYVCDVMIPALEHLKKTKHGVPCPDDAVMDPNTGESTEEEFKRWQTVWDAELDTIIAGFKAADAIVNGPPDQYFTPRTPEAVAAEREEAARKDAERNDGGSLYVSEFDYDLEGAKKWGDEQEEIRKKGFEMFSKRFFALWD